MLRREEQAATSMAVVVTASSTVNDNKEIENNYSYLPAAADGMEMAYLKETTIFDAGLMHHHQHHCHHNPTTTQY